VGKCGTAQQATDDDVIRRMRFACRITKDSHTHSEYVILIAVHGNNGYMNAPPCYGLRTLPVLSELSILPRRLAHHEFPVFLYRCRGADKSLARPGRKQATATEDFDFNVSYL